MDSLEYSIDAHESKSLFFNCEKTLYVEGEDDVIFWGDIVKICKKSIYIEEVGGKNEIAKIIKMITDENANVYVASDRDYNDFYDIPFKHPHIIYSFGHSIENTMFNVEAILKVIRDYSRKETDVKLELLNEIKNFEETVKPLLVLEIANEIYHGNISVLGKNCCKFLKNNNSIHICQSKVQDFIASNSIKFESEMLTSIDNKLKDTSTPIWQIVRGHFLTNFIINIIKHFVKKISNKTTVIPVDNIFPLFIGNVKDDENFDYFKQQIHLIA